MTVMQNQRLHHSFNSFSKIAEEKKKKQLKTVIFLTSWPKHIPHIKIFFSPKQKFEQKTYNMH